MPALLALLPKLLHGALAYWRFILPALLVVWALYERNGWQECESDWSAEKLEAANKLLEQKNKDQELRNRLQEKVDGLQTELADRGKTIIERIERVPVTTACVNSPAMRASDDGMQSLGFLPQERSAVGKNNGAAAAPAAGAGRR